jgi:hypothetical protein
VTGLRVTLAVLGAAALLAAAAIGRPEVLLPLIVLGVVAFIVSAGCLAADLLPLRRTHAACSALSLVDALALALGGQVSRVFDLAPAVALIALQAAPSVIGRGPRNRPRWRGGPPPGPP